MATGSGRMLALPCRGDHRGQSTFLNSTGCGGVKARTDLDQWRRERRLDACADLARSIHDLTEAISWRRDAIPSEVASVEQKLFEVMRGAAHVQLVGPQDVRNA